MMSPSGYYLPRLGLLMALLGSVLSDDNPCHFNVTGTSISKKKILCIGTLNDDLMVVTDKLEIWEFKNGGKNNVSINEAINNLYFAKEEPIPLEEKYPELAKTERYKTLKTEKIPSCNTAVDSNGRYLFLDTYKPTGHGIIWDVDKNVSYNGFSNAHDEKDRIRWISSNSLDNFYAFSDANNTLSMIRYALCSNGTMTNSIKHIDFMGQVFENGTCHYDKYPLLRKVCKKGTTDLYVQEYKSTEKCETVDWKVFNGFIAADDKIYLFGENDVITFPQKAYHSDESVAYQKTPYNLIINCTVAHDPRKKDITEKAPIAIGVIVGVSLVLAICILLCLLCLVRTALTKSKKKKHESKHSKKGDIRSSDMKGPGALSAGGSQRSKGGLVTAKPLSAATGGHSFATARSRGVSASVAPLTAATSSRRSGAQATARSSNVYGGSHRTNGNNMATARSDMKASRRGGLSSAQHSKDIGRSGMVTARSDNMSKAGGLSNMKQGHAVTQRSTAFSGQK